MKNTKIWNLLSLFEREIPEKEEFVTRWLGNTPKDEKDLDYVIVITGLYNDWKPKSRSVELNKQGIEIFCDYVNSYSTLRQEFEPNMAEQSYGKRIMRTLPSIIPDFINYNRKTHELKKQTYQKLVDIL
ncbi:MAG: hypothetical protein KAS15_02780 [Nanoarchaeota archaeon]|nr:hypothetical protein [Nanoarchaeota archaeon]MCK5630238.1 hypothetical protein [Nanoarchaeota archaeon]